jgi:hypothetical protein
VEVDWLVEDVVVFVDVVLVLVVFGVIVETVRAGVTPQTRNVDLAALVFVDRDTPYPPSHEQ